MRLRSIRQLKKLRGERVLVRTGFDISMPSGRFEKSDLFRLEAAIPTLRYLKRKGASVIIVTHRGRPKGYDHNLSLEPIISKLSKVMKVPIAFWEGTIDTYRERVHELKPGEIVALENIRFDSREMENDAAFAKQLASLGNIYVNDAFNNIHRTHASMVAITRYLPSYAGLQLEKEIHAFQGLLSRAKHPIVAIVGGSKISTKIRLIKKLMRRVDYVLLGGALANNVLAAMEKNVGKSLVESDMISWSKGLLSNKLKVPVDARVATSRTARPRIEAVGDVKKNDMILDLGPDTISLYEAIINEAKTIIWNGPLGLFEDPRYAKATNEMVTILKDAPGKVFAGGGETVKAILSQRAEQQLYFVSTGGGAMITMLEERPLPALRALQQN